MKIAKLLPLAACLLFGFAISTSVASAKAAAPTQTAAAPASQAGKMDPETPEADTALNLTDDQKTQIAAIRSDASDQRKAINKDKTLSDTDKETQLKTLKKSTRAKVWAILTPEQRTQWSAEAREHRQAKKAAGSSSPQ
jgi:Spy/CpxP family protein refolding chaperone